MFKKVVAGLLTLLIVIAALMTLLLFRLAGSSQQMDVSTGHENGNLRECPASPNCVSSQAASSDSHYIPPIANPEGRQWVRLLETVDGMEETTRINQEDNYAHYVFRTPLLGFIDDVEFYNASEQGVIHVRSASRVGQSDMGTNRKRIESIRSAL